MSLNVYGELYLNLQLGDSVYKNPEAKGKVEQTSEGYGQYSDFLKKDFFLSNDNGEFFWQDSIINKIATQQFEIRSGPNSIQSPLILPRLIPESPSMIPIQFEESYNFMEKRIPSFHSRTELRKGTEDDLDYKKMTKMRKESINLQEIDKDGFRIPKELRTDREDPDNQDIKQETIHMTPQMRLLSPIILPEGDSPLIKAEGKKKFLKTPSNACSLHVTVATPILNHTLVAPPYSPEAMRCLQLGEFGHLHEYTTQRNEKVRKNNEYGLRAHEVPNEGLQPSYFSPYMQQSPPFSHILAQPVDQLYVQQDDFLLDEEVKQEPELFPETKSEDVGKIGSLSLSERKKKILHYLEKRKKRIWKKKISYDCRKKVADKRLRIKGRFVTREQAFSLLGTTAEDLANNELLKTLIKSNDNCSIVTSAQNMKIRNIQTLFSAPNKKVKQAKEESELDIGKQAESNQIDETKTIDNHELRVEILKKNVKDQIVEIKIENIPKKDNVQDGSNESSQRSDEQLPIINNPIFNFRKLTPEECNPDHNKYHRKISCI